MLVRTNSALASASTSRIPWCAAFLRTGGTGCVFNQRTARKIRFTALGSPLNYADAPDMTVPLMAATCSIRVEKFSKVRDWAPSDLASSGLG